MELAGTVSDPLSDGYPLLTVCHEGQPSQEVHFPAEPPRSIRVTTSADAQPV